jgi:4-hydroxybenzoate polyprenyltransferase/phosphoserine phosphatase
LERIPLCVDLDGTLLKSDLLLEGLLGLLKGNLRVLLSLPLWLAHGKAALKAEVAARTEPNAALCPVHEDFLEWLSAQHRAGRRLVLCTAASRAVAERVATHFGLFDDIMSSDESTNLTGKIKAARLVREFGERGFDYAGNETRDLHIFAHARHAIVVSPSWLLSRRIRHVARVEQIFPGPTNRLRVWLRAARLHQWLKNLLIFAPVVAAQKQLDWQTVSSLALAFVAFSVCASATYILNDLLDLEADRAHPLKRHRPFAACDLPISHGLVAVLALGALGFAIAAFLPTLFLATLALYVASTVWYSTVLKRLPMVDALALAGLYTLRLLAGSAAAHILPSFWLLAFSMFLFLSLATAKRYTELRSLQERGGKLAAGRGYTIEDLPLVLTCGVGAGYISVLVLALYVHSAAGALYSRAALLWLICPLLLYWISRIWLKTHRGQLHDDPIVFAVTDRPSLLTFAAASVLVALAA